MNWECFDPCEAVRIPLAVAWESTPRRWSKGTAAPAADILVARGADLDSRAIVPILTPRDDDGALRLSEEESRPADHQVLAGRISFVRRMVFTDELCQDCDGTLAGCPDF